MHHMASTLLDQFGRSNDVSLEAHITILDLAICCFREKLGITHEEMAKAKYALATAGSLLSKNSDRGA